MNYRVTRSSLVISIFITALVASPVYAGETAIYTYDALGRLTQASKAGGPATGVQSATCYDPAGNRTSQAMSGVGGVPVPLPPCSSPPPPPPPPPPNLPPVANPDSMSMPCWSTASKNVVANDTDPDGNYPLTLVSVSPDGDVSAAITSSTTVSVEAQGARGVSVVLYVIKDSLGATANGTLSVTVNGSTSLCQG